MLAAEKRRGGWLAGVWLLHVVARVGAAGIERDQRFRCPGQHDRGALAALATTFGQGSEQPDQRARTAAERSPARLPRHGQRRRAEDGPGGRRGSPVLQRQAVGGEAPRSRCRRATSGSCSNRPARAACRRRRCSICGCLGRSPSAVSDASTCFWTCSTRSMTRPRKGSLRTISRPELGQPAVFVDPRRVMLGVRLNLGR